MKREIGYNRNDSCWCGSGKKYKQCHRIRESEKELPLEAVYNLIAKSTMIKICLHPDASEANCEKIISAHTLQRPRILGALVDTTKHVRTFYPLRKEKGELKLYERGWHEASTFSAFCKKHDDSTFASLEKSGFTGSKEELFLIAYRAICWEIYQKKRSIKAHSILRDNLDRGKTPEHQREIQEELLFSVQANRYGLKILEAEKELFDHAYRAENYAKFGFYELILSGELSVVATGAIQPTRLLSGQAIASVQVPGQTIAFGIDISSRGVSVVFSWFRGVPASEAFIDEIHQMPEKVVVEYIAQLFFVYCENAYFSSSWWNSLNAKQQAKVKELVENVNPYDYPPNFNFSLSLSPWKLLGRKRL